MWVYGIEEIINFFFLDKKILCYLSASKVLHNKIGRKSSVFLSISRNTFGVSVVEDSGKVLSNPKDVYKPKAGWGIIPMDCAKHHEEAALDVLEKALGEAKVKLEDIDIISYSKGPGLPPCLKGVLNFSKDLSKKYGKPLIGVNHCVAHIEIGKLTTKLNDPVVLYVSGGNTQVISLVGGRYRIFGEVMDIGIGNALDKFSREVGLGFPGGPAIERLALSGKWVELPYVVKGMDLSFTGIVTEAIKKYKSGNKLEDVCFSLQETTFAMLAEVTERALAHTGKEEVLLTGGVAANKRLQEMLDIMCKERGAKFAVVPKEYSGDCGANIGWTGIVQYKSGDKGLLAEKADINPVWRTDEVEVRWG